MKKIGIIIMVLFFVVAFFANVVTASDSHILGCGNPECQKCILITQAGTLLKIENLVGILLVCLLVLYTHALYLSVYRTTAPFLSTLVQCKVQLNN